MNSRKKNRTRNTAWRKNDRFALPGHDMPEISIPYL